MRSFILASAAVLSLSGCAGFDAAWSGANNYYSGQLTTTVKNIQGTNDNTAKTWADAGCATPYGEVVRNGSGNPNLPAAIITLCGAPSGFTMIHSAPTATATTTIPTETVPVPAAPAPVPAPPIPTGQTPSSSAAPIISNKNTAQAANNVLAAKIAALMAQH